MSKYTPIKLTQLSANESAAVDAINQNLDSIKEYIDDSLSRSAKSPSQMLADLDMNGQKLLNLGAPTKDTDVVRLKDVIENKEEIKTLVNTASVAVEKAMEAAETAESAAGDMADQIQLAKDWATKTNGPVADGEYSSKWYAENIGADVHTVADIAEDVTAVAGNATNIDAVAGNENNINTVAGISSDVSTVASNDSNVTTVATNMSDVNDCATNMSAIQAAPTQAANAAASAEAAAISAAGTHFKLFQHQWFDYELNDMAWLRADTFSWQDGTVYSNAYNHLVDDATNGTSQTETIAGHTITYTLAEDGHKIVSDANASAVEGLYNDTGVAWYYILDLVNHRFKLPRTKYGFTGLRDTVGKYVPESLPNIQARFTTILGTAEGAIQFEENSQASFGGGGYVQAIDSFNASRSSSAYQDNAPVQQRATQMYLYFYVGQFSQTATEQTAGLNSELFNGKVDLDAANLSTAGKSLISGLGMPSDTYDDITTGASGTEYTAPANGYVEFSSEFSSGWTNAAISFNGVNYCNVFQGILSSAAFSWAIFFPIKKGMKWQINWGGGNINTGVAWFSHKFIYAEGEENV